MIERFIYIRSLFDRNAALAHALIDGRAVTEFERKGKAAREIDRLWHVLKEELAL